MCGLESSFWPQSDLAQVTSILWLILPAFSCLCFPICWDSRLPGAGPTSTQVPLVGINPSLTLTQELLGDDGPSELSSHVREQWSWGCSYFFSRSSLVLSPLKMSGPPFCGFLSAYLALHCRRSCRLPHGVTLPLRPADALLWDSHFTLWTPLLSTPLARCVRAHDTASHSLAVSLSHYSGYASSC